MYMNESLSVGTKENEREGKRWAYDIEEAPNQRAIDTHLKPMLCPLAVKL